PLRESGTTSPRSASGGGVSAASGGGGAGGGAASGAGGQVSLARSVAKSSTLVTPGAVRITSPVPLTRIATTPPVGGEPPYVLRSRPSGSASARSRNPIGTGLGSAGATCPTASTLTPAGAARAVSNSRSVQAQPSASSTTAGRLLRSCTRLPSAATRVRSATCGPVPEGVPEPVPVRRG